MEITWSGWHLSVCYFYDDSRKNMYLQRDRNTHHSRKNHTNYTLLVHSVTVTCLGPNYVHIGQFCTSKFSFNVNSGAESWGWCGWVCRASRMTKAQLIIDLQLLFCCCWWLVGTVWYLVSPTQRELFSTIVSPQPFSCTVVDTKRGPNHAVERCSSFLVVGNRKHSEYVVDWHSCKAY